MPSIIHSKHLKLFKLIKFTDGKNYKAIKLFLNLSSQNISNYLKDINTLISDNQKYVDRDSVIKQILVANNNLDLFKENLSVTKEERILFLTLFLLTRGYLNLDELSKTLKITRRSLNTDLDSVKKHISPFGLTISSIPGKGIFLSGEHTSRKRALFSFTYKLLIEKEYLPNIFYDSFPYLFNDENNPQLTNDIDKILDLCHFDNHFRGHDLFQAFYLSVNFLDNKNSKEKTFASELQDFHDFSSYFSESFNREILLKLHKTLISSAFKDLDSSNITNFVRTLYIGVGNFEHCDEVFFSNVNFWKKYISDYLDIPVTEKNSSEFNKVVSKILFFSTHDECVPIYDFSFFDLNLNKTFIDKCFNLYFNLKKHHWNLSFSDIIAIFFSLNYFEKDKKEVVIVFNSIPKYLIYNMKESLEFKYDIRIKDVVNYSDFEKYKENNSVKTVGTFTDLSFKDKDLNILDLIISF